MTAALHARVLIVGAGPVGMTLACELRTAGVEVDIISRTRRESPHSRATIIWPRVLELLDRVGIAEPIIARGHYFDQMNYYSGKQRIGLIRFDRLPDVQYPFAVTCPQWKIEQAIEDRLSALGCRISYDHEFIGGNQTRNGVACAIREPDGQCVEQHYDFIVGADGYHSAVREAFGFQFAGETLHTRLAITDAQILGETTSSEAAYYLTRGGNMVLAPLGDGVFRVGTTVPDDYTGPEQPTRDEVDTALDRMLIADAMTHLSTDHQAVIERAYYRGWTDTLISRFVDVLLAIPYLLLATGLAAACTLGQLVKVT